MPTPTRPVSGAPVDSIWGMEVHDAAFTPSGGFWKSQSAAIGSGLNGQNVPLLAVNDPATWLPAPGGASLVVPADGDGLYALSVLAQPVTNEAGRWSFVILQAGIMVAAGHIDNPVTSAATSWGFTASGLLLLTAGEAINLRHDSAGGTAGRVNYSRIMLTRVGRTFGAA